MSHPEDSPNLIFLPEAELETTLQRGVQQLTVVVDAYWAVHPERGLVIWSLSPKSPQVYPQYNADQVVAEKLTKALYPWAECKQIALVLLDRNGMPLRKEN